MKDTPLHLAVQDEDTETVKALLAAGADPNVKGEYGRTPLHEAAWIGHSETIRLLLAAGSDPNAKDHKGLTPLHTAASGNSEIVQILLPAGADPNALTNDQRTPLHIAGSGSVETVRMFLSMEAVLYADYEYLNKGSVLYALARGTVEIIQKLLAAGSDPDAVDQDGKKPLQQYTETDDVEIAQVLLSAGAYDSPGDVIKALCNR